MLSAFFRHSTAPYFVQYTQTKYVGNTLGMSVNRSVESGRRTFSKCEQDLGKFKPSLLYACINVKKIPIATNILYKMSSTWSTCYPSGQDKA